MKLIFYFYFLTSINNLFIKKLIITKHCRFVIKKIKLKKTKKNTITKTTRYKTSPS